MACSDDTLVQHGTNLGTELACHTEC